MTTRQTLPGSIAAALMLASTVPTFAAQKAAEAAPKNPVKKSDLDKMQGKWKIVSAQRGGVNAPQAILNSKLNVKKDVFTLSTVDPNGQKRESSIQIKLDSAKSPKQIDFIKNGKVDSFGIYKLDGKKLTVCFDRGKKPRPKNFESPADSRIQLIVFEREK